MIRHAKHVERARRGGFGQSVAFVDRHAGTTEERQQFRIKRRTARDDPLGASAEHLTQRGIDHRIERRAACLGKRSGLPLGADFLHIILRGDHGCGERDALGAMTGLLGSSVVHLLQHTRNNDHDGRLGHLQIGGQRLDALRDVDMQITRHTDVVDGTGEGMRLRQEQQDGVLLAMQQFRHIIGQIERGGAIMLMRHLHALRRGGRTGRVHNGAQIGLLHGIDSRIERLIAHTGAIRLDFVKTTGLEADDVLQSRAIGFGPVRLRLHISGFHDQQTRIGIVDDIADLLGGIGIVNRGEHAAAGHDGRVEHIPIVGGAAHESHAIALLQTIMQQALRDGADVGERLICGLGVPIAILLERVQWFVAHTSGAVGVDIVDGGAFV